MIFAGLYGGMLADAFDRRLILLLAAIVAWGSTIALALIAWTGYVGIIAAIGAIWLPSLLGGLAIIVLIVSLTRRQRGFLHYAALAPVP